MDLFIEKTGTKVSYEKGYFILENKDEKTKKISFDNIDNILINQGCTLTTNFIKNAILKDISIYFIDEYGNVYGNINSIIYNTNPEIKIAQLKIFATSLGRDIGRKWIVEKINNQKLHLQKIYSRRGILNSFVEIEKEFDFLIENIKQIDLNQEQYSNIIMGYEGRASVLYFENIKKFLPKPWQFEKRETQGASEPYNIVLNYIFGVLYSKIEKSLILAGLDIQIGVIHSLGKNRKSLVYDFIEPFRILGWEITFVLFSKKMLNKSDFDLKEKKITPTGKRVIIQELYSRLNNIIEYNGKKIKYEEIIRKKADSLVKELMKNEIHN